MNCLTPRPAQVQAEFAKRYEVSPKEATDYFYKLSQDSDYIRRYRVKKTANGKWTALMVRLISQSTYQTGERSKGDCGCEECKGK